MTYIDANKLANDRRDIRKKRLKNVEIIMIKNKFKTARNKKGYPGADTMETESEHNEQCGKIRKRKE